MNHKISEFSLYATNAQEQNISKINNLLAANAELQSNLAIQSEKNQEMEFKLASLNESNKDLTKSLSIKAIYIHDIDKQLDEALKSNKFYEEQLINSDNVINALKENQSKASKASIDLSGEISKLKKSYVNENALLKLKIEELEFLNTARNKTKGES